MPENTELEDLDQLVNCPGWSVFTAMVEKQWGRASDGYHDAVEKAAKGDNPHAADHLRQILACQREILKVMAMVPNRIKLLKQGEKKGPLATMFGRRGSL